MIGMGVYLLSSSPADRDIRKGVGKAEGKVRARPPALAIAPSSLAQSLTMGAGADDQAHEVAGKAKGGYAELKGDAKNAAADAKGRYN